MKCDCPGLINKKLADMKGDCPGLINRTLNSLTSGMGHFSINISTQQQHILCCSHARLKNSPIFCSSKQPTSNTLISQGNPKRTNKVENKKKNEKS